MGVNGLTTYMKNNAHQYLRPFELHDCNIVIDGYNVAYTLYEIYAGYSCSFGGDNDVYYRSVVGFFQKLKDCNITPLVILDGTVKEQKLETIKERFSSNIKNLKKVTWDNSQQILPSLCKQVFVDAMKDCSIPFSRNIFEADEEIAALSAKLNCPVLTDDSDFFIYGVKFIPFSMLSMLSTTAYKKDQHYKYLKCYIYEVKYLTNAASLGTDVVPLLAVLLGNDYVERFTIRSIMQHLISTDTFIGGGQNELYIRKVIQWLTTETYDSAVEKILGSLEEERKDEVLHLLNAGIDSYKLRPCTTYDFFRTHYEEIIFKCTNKVEEEDKKLVCKELEKLRIGEEDSTQKDSDDDQQLVTSFPLWFRKGIVFNRIEDYITTLLYLKVIFSGINIEHFDFEDSKKIALPIIKHTFTILHYIEGNDEDKINSQQSPNGSDSNSVPYFWYIGRRSASVEVYSMKCEIGPPPIVPFNPHNPDPKLLQSIFNEFQLDCPELFRNIDKIPCDLRLYILAIIYWMHNSRHVDLIHLQSILICLVVLRTIDSKITPIRELNDFDNEFGKYIQNILPFRSIQQQRESSDKRLQNLSPSDRIKFISKSDCVLVQRNLLKHFHIQKCYGSQYTRHCTPILHAFAEFQSVLTYMYGLNGLLKNIYESPKIEQCYCGVFIFNMYELLKSQVDRDHYIQHHIFQESVMIFDFYKSLWELCCNFVPSVFKTLLLNEVSYKK